MHADVRDLLTSLRTAEDVAPHWSVVDDWIARRELVRLRELGGALAELPTDEWQARSVLEHILKRLALTRDPEFAGAVRDLARVHDAPYLASLVASGQRPEVAASVAQGEFGACLAQELVLRSNGAALDESCWRRGHPLAWLPLRLAEIEEGVELPHYSEGGVGFAMPYGPLDAPEGPDAILTAAMGRDITSSTFAEHAATVFADWLENSNGKVEARVFGLEPTDETSALAETLGRTALECLAGATSTRAWEVSAGDAFAVAFAAASSGGAYTSGRCGAYGRLDAWRTMAVLVGAEAAAPFDEVSAMVTAARWFRFQSDTAWFYGVAWDVGLAVLRKDGRSLAVLAATDTD